MKLILNGLFAVSFSLLALITNCFARTDDPCSHISGAWRGTVSGYNCVWDTSATFNQYNETVQIDFYNSNGRYSGSDGRRCVDSKGLFFGTCKNAFITFRGNNGIDTHGTIFENKITLIDSNNVVMVLYKT